LTSPPIRPTPVWIPAPQPSAELSVQYEGLAKRWMLKRNNTLDHLFYTHDHLKHLAVTRAWRISPNGLTLALVPDDTLNRVDRTPGVLGYRDEGPAKGVQVY
jgi:hypothetical protein